VKTRGLSLLLLLAGAGSALAQSDVHGCEAAPAIRQAYADAKRSADRVQSLRQALARYPDDIFLNRDLLVSKEIPAGSLAAEYKTKLDAMLAKLRQTY
jgi:hypothetical protein